jgi:hypothetical protein
MLLILLLASCANVPKVETNAMRAELRSQRARIDDLAILSTKAYLTREQEVRCPALIAPSLECFVAAMPPSPLASKAVYIIQTNDATREQVIAIRGTTPGEDYFTDLDTHKKMDPHLWVPVHARFQRYADTVYLDARRRGLLKPGYKIITTGHSLGGAAALLVGLYIYVEPSQANPVAGVYTFGQPKVFDNVGVTSWPFFARRVFRIVDCADPVPILPTNASKFNALINVNLFSSDRQQDYQHMGQSLLLLDGGHYWMPGSVELERGLVKSIQDSVADVFHGDNIDHLIVQYKARLGAIPTSMPEDGPLDPSPPNRFPCSRVPPEAHGTDVISY